jgi:CrcB protein
MTIVYVAAGGLVGTLARYGLSVAFPSLWTIAVVNLAGSFLLGLLTHLGAGWSPEVRTGLGVGVLGGFTTFSTFTVQTVLEADGGRGGRAAAYVAVSVAGGLVAAVAGYVAGRWIA